jgi:hypothetical protein
MQKNFFTTLRGIAQRCCKKGGPVTVEGWS